MDKDKLGKYLKARFDFAKAVIALHETGMDDKALLDKVSQCEREYLAIMIDGPIEKVQQHMKLRTEASAGNA
jgi:hypothetical protein